MWRIGRGAHFLKSLKAEGHKELVVELALKMTYRTAEWDLKRPTGSGNGT